MKKAILLCSILSSSLAFTACPPGYKWECRWGSQGGKPKFECKCYRQINRKKFNDIKMLKKLILLTKK